MEAEWWRVARQQGILPGDLEGSATSPDGLWLLIRELVAELPQEPPSEKEARLPIPAPPEEPTATPPPAEPTRTPTPTRPLSDYRIAYGAGDSTAEQAFRLLVDEERLDSSIYLVILSDTSGGLEGQIYGVLRRRKFRATTGPDEGIDTRSLFCAPGCIFVPTEEKNALGIGGWQEVLLHEARHVEQLSNNPNMARDFVTADGGRSLYAGFCEACADDGLYTTPLYYAKERLEKLRSVVGPEREELVARACHGDKDAYRDLSALYNQLVGDPGAFGELFRPMY